MSSMRHSNSTHRPVAYANAALKIKIVHKPLPLHFSFLPKSYAFTSIIWVVWLARQKKTALFQLGKKGVRSVVMVIVVIWNLVPFQPNSNVSLLFFFDGELRVACFKLLKVLSCLAVWVSGRCSYIVFHAVSSRQWACAANYEHTRLQKM